MTEHELVIFAIGIFEGLSTRLKHCDADAADDCREFAKFFRKSIGFMYPLRVQQVDPAGHA